ncbi:Bug family tripartite tricarboxylate transporter substrate binding protein [Hydrogenophaga sp.]|uniref:Bug family tripartite tricarboxylate transporter substrate binding protein n=1 Tax=Hydrogenophaga sp. TaxID=1904254 RepID=UPI0039C899AA
MNPQRRHAVTTLSMALCLGGLGLSAPAHADDFPSRPLTLVVPFAPGGPTDAMARTLASALKPALGQTVVVENKAGAGGNIGAEAVSRAAPDGYTMLFGTSGPLAINQYLYSKPGYAPDKSFAPVIRIGHLPNVLLINPQVPAKNVAELVALAKVRPDGMSFASSGNGASSHLAGVMFNLRNGTQIQHIPYKGTGPALTDLLGGQVSMSFTDVLTAKPHVQSGRLRALAVTTAGRSRALPEVPTLKEEGVADMDVSVFFGIVVPAGTPKAVIDRLNAAFVKALADPEVNAKLIGQGVELPADTSAAHLAAYMRQESERWRDVIGKAGIRAD